MKDIIKQLLTGKDNATYDIGRVTWFLGFIVVIAIAIYSSMHGSVSLRELAESLGIVSGAGGASVMLKKDSEPQ